MGIQWVNRVLRGWMLGSFMGNTPSTLNLTAGKHDIVVKKTGYADWTRSMTVAAGSVRLSAEMVAK